MMEDIYKQQGAVLAPDGIPLHFGDLKAEYHAALNRAVLLDRSHEGRIIIEDKDRYELLNRMSTNNLMHVGAGQGVPTIFTNANARVIDRVVAFNRGEHLLVITGPGRGEAVRNYLQRSIFFNDEARVSVQNTRQFTLHGSQAEAMMTALIPEAAQLGEFSSMIATIAGVDVLIGRLKPYVGSHWFVITEERDAPAVWQAMIGQGITPAGGLTYNTLRIRAGIPGVGRELSTEYIPLELGLWDEISFNKGCYTGQEIIARMESRNKLARTLVRLSLPEMVNVPAELFHEGKPAGMLTSSVFSPDDEIFAMGVIKTAFAEPDTVLTTSEGLTAQVQALLGVQPLNS